jgi:hypothetical protein
VTTLADTIAIYRDAVLAAYGADVLHRSIIERRGTRYVAIAIWTDDTKPFTETYYPRSRVLQAARNLYARAAAQRLEVRHE